MEMKYTEQQIRAAARRLLAEKQVDVVIGFAKGTVPMRDYPYFAYTPEEAEKLAAYLIKLK